MINYVTLTGIDPSRQVRPSALRRNEKIIIRCNIDVKY